MIIQDKLSYKLSFGLIIIFWINFIILSYIALYLNFNMITYIFYLIPFFLYFPSKIFFILYSIKKIPKYAKIGFILGSLSQILSIWFNLGVLASSITSYNIPSFIIYFAIMLICSIIVALFFNFLIFRRSKRDTLAGELIIPQVPTFYFKLLLLIGILLFMGFSIIPYIIRVFTTRYLLRHSTFLTLLYFEPSFIVFFLVFFPEYMAIDALDNQLQQLAILFSWIVILGLIIIIISSILLGIYSKQLI